MKKIIDARGKQCPIPVILAKDAMKEEKAVEIVVDNEIAVQNLMKLAKQKNYQMHSEKKEDVFVVNLTKEEEQSENIIEEPVVNIFSANCLHQVLLPIPQHTNYHYVD